MKTRPNLIDEGSSVRGHLQDDLLRDLPDGLVQVLQVIGKVETLEQRETVREPELSRS